jgi:hypothetical protein
VPEWGRDNSVESTRREAGDKAPLPGVIDTIGIGYAALVLRPLVILPMIVLDLYLLLGPRVTIDPVASTVARRMDERGGDWSAVARDVERVHGFNIFELAALPIPSAAVPFPPLRTPAIAPAIGERPIDSLGIELSALPSGLVLIVALLALVVGLLCAAAYRSLLAATATGDPTPYRSLDVGSVASVALALVGWTAILAGLALLIALPVLVATFVGALFGYPEISILWIALLIPAAWAFVHFFFSIHALVLDRNGPFAALKSSYQVVHGNFWPSLRFIAVSLLITTGLTFALRALASNLPGALLAIILNAVIASGMIVAATLFYRDRARLLGVPSSYAER